MVDARMLDGNAIAGLLTEIFAVEATTAVGTCAACGASEPIGAVQVYLGAGVVLRCPHCSNVLGKIVKNGERIWVSFQGMRALELGV